MCYHVSNITVGLIIAVLMCCSGVGVTGNAIGDIRDNVNDFNDDLQQKEAEDWVKGHV